MEFVVSKENIGLLKDYIDEGRDAAIVDILKNLHHADIAEIIDNLNLDEAKYIIRLIDTELLHEVLLDLDEELRVKILESLTSQEIAAQIDQMDSDDAVDLIAELPKSKKEEVLSKIDDEDQAKDIAALLLYDDDTAGGLMAKELIKVNISWTVGQCIREMRKQAEDINEIYTIYVVDNLGRLQGLLSLKKLLFASSSIKTKVSEIFTPSAKAVKVDADSETVAKLMEKYDLVVLPVVDDDNVLLGRITIDDIVDVIKEEAERDYQLASGLSDSVDTSDTVLKSSRARIPWLLIGLFGGIMSSRVIGVYEDQISINPTLAFFMPLIAAMGGNAGVQSSAIVVQSLANNTLQMDGLWGRLGKETAVALINGLVCGIIIFLYDYIFLGDSTIGITVSVALISVIMIASLFGTFVPMLLNRFNIDPALATGPFITTTNDILGLFIYFYIARIMFGI
ncbi:MAG: magnesium transporter [Luteibaculaceae bacterium]